MHALVVQRSLQQSAGFWPPNDPANRPGPRTIPTAHATEQIKLLRSLHVL
jgi:hypothetical protein